MPVSLNVIMTGYASRVNGIKIRVKHGQILPFLLSACMLYIQTMLMRSRLSF